MEYAICPECGAYAVMTREWQVQEIDLLSLQYNPEEMLQESECQECGWSSSRMINMPEAVGADWGY